MVAGSRVVLWCTVMYCSELCCTISRNVHLSHSDSPHRPGQSPCLLLDFSCPTYLNLNPSVWILTPSLMDQTLHLSESARTRQHVACYPELCQSLQIWICVKLLSTPLTTPGGPGDQGAELLSGRLLTPLAPHSPQVLNRKYFHSFLCSHQLHPLLLFAWPRKIINLSFLSR